MSVELQRARSVANLMRVIDSAVRQLSRYPFASDAHVRAHAIIVPHE